VSTCTCPLIICPKLALRMPSVYLRSIAQCPYLYVPCARIAFLCARALGTHCPYAPVPYAHSASFYVPGPLVRFALMRRCPIQAVPLFYLPGQLVRIALMRQCPTHTVPLFMCQGPWCALPLRASALYSVQVCPIVPLCTSTDVGGE
jgi:hypothetical protein